MKDKVIRIRLEGNVAEKASFVKKVLDDLPNWFEFEEAKVNYAEKSKIYDTYIISENNYDIGFLIVKETSKDAIEIYCLGILNESRSKGYGRLLVDEVLNLYRKSHSFAQVKTLDEGLDKYYDQTIGFYKSLGFLKLETIKEIWGDDNPCMIMVKSL
ncbi:GNAT family N-acetyltransferase [uncultured Anaerococcus sp.]|uniref:GNAT family N-acetyltransferase n=1 Tax=uncultured Anaerococcus sp. TaxID=293428 RepID=UPI002888FF63|nr:GNAT family N-acetyltransferase [uncultured Anaerococcus sp.]